MLLDRIRPRGRRSGRGAGTTRTRWLPSLLLAAVLFAPPALAQSQDDGVLATLEKLRDASFLDKEQIVERLSREPRLPFAALFTPPRDRGRLIGLFLAILELTKQRRILPEQDVAFGDLWVVLAPPEDTPATAEGAG